MRRSLVVATLLVLIFVTASIPIISVASMVTQSNSGIQIDLTKFDYGMGIHQRTLSDVRMLIANIGGK